jgi:hypothetical protein
MGRRSIQQAAFWVGVVILAGVVILLLEWVGIDIRA